MIRKLLLLIVLIGTIQLTNAQFALGDIAFTAYNADTTVPAGTNNDSFTFVLLRAVTSGEQISFTENGWFVTGGFRNNENTLTFTFTNNYALGTQIAISETPFEARDQFGIIAGSLTGSGLSLATGGDQIFAYNPSNMPTAGNESGFIAAIHMNGDWDADATSSTTSAKPNIFTDGVNSISINPEVDNARLAPTNCGSASTVVALRTLVNTASNWESDNTMGYPHIPPACDFIGTLSINDQVNEDRFALYPNPVERTLHIKMPVQVVVSKINVLDVNGKLVMSAEGNIESIDVNTLERGMYFVKIHTNDKILIKKIVKN